MRRLYWANVWARQEGSHLTGYNSIEELLNRSITVLSLSDVYLFRLRSSHTRARRAKGWLP
jgi:hypothetical protein